jgi:hypothetical protein
MILCPTPQCGAILRQIEVCIARAIHRYSAISRANSCGARNAMRGLAGRHRRHRFDDSPKERTLPVANVEEFNAEKTTSFSRASR